MPYTPWSNDQINQFSSQLPLNEEQQRLDQQRQMAMQLMTPRSHRPAQTGWEGGINSLGDILGAVVGGFGAKNIAGQQATNANQRGSNLAQFIGGEQQRQMELARLQAETEAARANGGQPNAAQSSVANSDPFGLGGSLGQLPPELMAILGGGYGR